MNFATYHCLRVMDIAWDYCPWCGKKLNDEPEKDPFERIKSVWD